MMCPRCGGPTRRPDYWSLVRFCDPCQLIVKPEDKQN